MMEDYQAENYNVGQCQRPSSAKKLWPNYGPHDKQTVLLMNFSRHYGGILLERWHEKPKHLGTDGRRAEHTY